MSLPEAFPTAMFFKNTLRSNFSNSIIPQGSMLLFAESDGDGGSDIVAMLPGGTFMKVGGNGVLYTESKTSALTVSSGSATINPRSGICYTHTLSGDLSVTFSTPIAGYVPTIELWLTQPSTALNISFTNTIWWDNGYGYFDPDNEDPITSIGNRTYCFVFRWDGSNWLGKLAYYKKVIA